MRRISLSPKVLWPVASASTLVALLASLILLPVVPSAAEARVPAVVTARKSSLEVSALTYTDSRHPRRNYSLKRSLRISTSRYTGYLAFPAVALRAGETITGATLTLKVTKANRKARKGGIVVVPVGAGWREAELTKRTAPKTLGGKLNRAAKARAGRSVTITFSARDAARYLSGGSALRLRLSRAKAEVRIAATGAAAPTLRFTISRDPATPVDNTPFSLAVIPDTQLETTTTTDPRFPGRTQWLVDNRGGLNLKYVLHTGDVVNWGWLAPSQYRVARAAIKNLSNAGIPYALTIGNHDTRAVGWDGKPGSSGVGGAAYASSPACPGRLGATECRSNLLVRKTAEFNRTFPLEGVSRVGGAFETGKVDNVWTTFEAGDTQWLVLTLELWPRAKVVAWAADVVSKHPSHNVIVQTHSYLTSTGEIDATKGGYGATSGTYLYDNLIRRYPNIKLVFSGHTGTAAKRVDTGDKGNAIVSYLQAFHSTTTNPVRIVTIDPSSGWVTTRIEAPLTHQTWTEYSTSDQLDLLR